MNSKHGKEPSARIRVPERIVSRLLVRALFAFSHDERVLEEHLLGFAPRHLVCDPVFLRVTLIPLETATLRELAHGDRSDLLYAAIIYRNQEAPGANF
jgi:hypothetical protein